MTATTELKKTKLKLAANKRVAAETNRAEAQDEVDGLIRELKDAGVGVDDLSRLAQLSRNGVYKALDR